MKKATMKARVVRRFADHAVGDVIMVSKENPAFFELIKEEEKPKRKYTKRSDSDKEADE